MTKESNDTLIELKRKITRKPGYLAIGIGLSKSDVTVQITQLQC